MNFFFTDALSCVVPYIGCRYRLLPYPIKPVYFAYLHGYLPLHHKAIRERPFSKPEKFTKVVKYSV